MTPRRRGSCGARAGAPVGRRRVLPSCGLALLVAVPLPGAAVSLSVSVHGPDAEALADAVVAVFVAGAPRLAEAPAAVELGQRDKRFTPPVLAVQSGTPVSFPNFDTVRHHVYSFSPIKTFEIKLYVGTPTAPVVFDRAGTAVLGCNIHDGMAAFVRVVDTPYFARTDAQGHARLELPAGSHRVQVWHASLPPEGDAPLQPLQVGPGGGAVKLSLLPP